MLFAKANLSQIYPAYKKLDKQQLGMYCCKYIFYVQYNGGIFKHKVAVHVLLSRFYLDFLETHFIQILSRFYPDYI